MAPRLVQREDDDVSSAIHDILVGEGIAVRLNARCISVAPGNAGVAVQVDCAEGSPTIEASHLLLAVGRRPNTDDLGLDAAGVARDDHGYIVVDDELRTSVPGIWALGECNGKGAFTHTVYNDCEIVASNLLDGATRRVRIGFRRMRSTSTRHSAAPASPRQKRDSADTQSWSERERWHASDGRSRRVKPTG